MSGPPSRPFREVGYLEARQQSMYSQDDESVVLKNLREQAAHNGCDGVVVQRADTVAGGGYVANGNGVATVTTLRGYRGVCIVFTGPKSGGGTHEEPEGAVGYKFGDSVEQAATACSRAGGKWTSVEGKNSCDQVPSAVGFAGRAELTFCSDKLCALEIVAPFQNPTDDLVLERWRNTKRLLEAHYAGPTGGSDNLPPACTGRLLDCLENKQVEFQLLWEWNSGTRIAMSVAGPRGDLALRIRYASRALRESGASQGL